jgi:hypothetical protein
VTATWSPPSLAAVIDALTPNILYSSARPPSASRVELRLDGNLNVRVVLPARAADVSGGGGEGDRDIAEQQRSWRLPRTASFDWGYNAQKNVAESTVRRLFQRIGCLAFNSDAAAAIPPPPPPPPPFTSLAPARLKHEEPPSAFLLGQPPRQEAFFKQNRTNLWFTEVTPAQRSRRKGRSN